LNFIHPEGHIQVMNSILAKVMDIISLLGLLGVGISAYAIYVEKNARKTKKRTALCDVNDGMSCSLVLTSDYAKLGEVYLGLSKDNPFNVPNTYYGFLFYVAVTIYPLWPFTLIPFREALLFGASILSIGICVLLAWILYFKLRNFCTVCVASWIVNSLILYQAYKQLFG